MDEAHRAYYESRAREYDHRRKKYVVMMGLRALCVISAATTYKVSLSLALAFIVGGMVLPWCAVSEPTCRPSTATPSTTATASSGMAASITANLRGGVRRSGSLTIRV